MALSELNKRIGATLADAFKAPVWVVAEVASVSSSGGHTYLDVVEKREDSVIAKARGMVWARKGRMLTEFARVTGSKLSAGMKVLILAQVSFHAVHGLALTIEDIDPAYSLGEMERQRREILERLTREGLLEKNKGLALPAAPQRIAIVSSEKAAGLHDFLYRLANNAYGYTFSLRLFAATVQGSTAEASVLSAMGQVSSEAECFDCMVLIRGGGGALDLACFDSYPLARAIAEFPLPVIAGIGHQKDRSICDEVAGLSVATPTAAADWLITRMKEFDDRLGTLAVSLENGARRRLQVQGEAVDRLANRFMISARRDIAGEQARLEDMVRRIDASARRGVDTGALNAIATRLQIRSTLLLERESSALAAREKDLRASLRRLFERAQNELDRCERDVRCMDPMSILRRGFSITRIDGRAVLDPASAPAGSRIETQVLGGRIMSIVEKSEDCNE